LWKKWQASYKLVKAKKFTTASIVVLVKFATISQAIYHLTTLGSPRGIIKAILKLEQAFRLWIEFRREKT
jgi:hypothetical protein